MDKFLKIGSEKSGRFFVDFQCFGLSATRQTWINPLMNKKLPILTAQKKDKKTIQFLEKSLDMYGKCNILLPLRISRFRLPG